MNQNSTVRSAFPFGSTPAQYIEHHTIPLPECGCHIWMGPVSKTGYGHMVIKRRAFRPHRVSWEIANGPIPDGMFVLHRCDIRTCVNPDHLFLGSHKQNMRDMKDKSRAASGERNGSAKLTIDDVKAIRNSELSYARLASIYGVVWATIQNIKSAKTWRFVA